MLVMWIASGLGVLLLAVAFMHAVRPSLLDKVYSGAFVRRSERDQVEAEAQAAESDSSAAIMNGDYVVKGRVSRSGGLRQIRSHGLRPGVSKAHRQSILKGTESAKSRRLLLTSASGKKRVVSPKVKVKPDEAREVKATGD